MDKLQLGNQRGVIRKPHGFARLFCIAAIIGALYLFPPTGRLLAASQNPMVHQQGTQLVDGAGKALKLRGVNLGGWLLWEGGIWGGSPSLSESKILAGLIQTIGLDETVKFQKQFDDQFITEGDIARIAQLRYNVIRVPFNYRLLEDDTQPFAYKQSGWDALDRVIAWAAQYHIYVVLDLHAAPGAQSWLPHADPHAPTLVWSSKQSQARTVALWKAIASRYAGRSNVAGYDLLNEPNTSMNAALVSLYQQIIAAIRSVDPNHMVILEGNRLAVDFSAFTGPLDSNQLYSFHSYAFGSVQSALSRYKAIASAQQVPFWCGEFGDGSYANLKSAVQAYEQADYVAGWASWTWKRAPSRYPALNSIDIPAPWSKVMALIGASQPGFKAYTLDAANQFLKAVAPGSIHLDGQMVQVVNVPAQP